ncbi:inactive pancreatic lipase-related protein 1-like isoform X1 [Pomacea canaliculata]|uniref:inactive pancreatic lipase-related protein 1-like isoform X1 n=1 Tax=Pomacea canaliculata TaxID=400727 RepID=UPI000D73428F|nr:inactive pancreatic lipase-related protein 1-like isoform X1 [Pomacea canaliculata]
MLSHISLLLILIWCTGCCGAVLSVTYREMLPQFQYYDVWWPFINSFSCLPQSASQQRIRFLLYTPENPTSPQLLDPMNVTSVKNSNFNTQRPTKFIVHGYSGSANNKWVQDMVKEMLTQNVNIIAVDWKKGAQGPNYYQATANTRVVGNYIATLILLLEKLGVPMSAVHVIGHSLGAQIAGYTGHGLDGRLGRITGLDPAGPNFETYDRLVKLDKDDAQFVDAIHTNAKSLVLGGLGTAEMCGDADFFPNGGVDMPGCADGGTLLLKTLSGLLTGQVKDAIGALACNHMRATSYFTASIRSNPFVAYPCASLSEYKSGHCTSCAEGCSNMGYHASSNSSGLYVLSTGSSYPY